MGEASPWCIGAAEGTSWPWWSISRQTRTWTWYVASPRGPECHGPRRWVYTLMLGDINANTGWAMGFRIAPGALAILWEDFLRDTGLSRCTPAVEVPAWTDGRGRVGVIDQVLQGTAPKKGSL